MREPGALERSFALILLADVLAVAVSSIVPWFTYVAGAISVLAMLSGIAIASRQTRAVAALIAGIGLVALLVAWVGFDRPPGIDVLANMNQDFITMIASVNFLNLIAVREAGAPPKLRGIPALIRTGLIVHLIGAVINVVIVGLAADRLRAGQRLGIADAALLSRTFMLASIWTPFWVAASVAAVRVGGASFPVYTLIGLGTGLLMTVLFAIENARMRTRGELRAYSGYTLSWRTAVLPAILVALILAAHFLTPLTPVPRLVVLSILAVTLIGLLPRHAHRSVAVMGRHAARNLMSNRSETTILTSAGLLTSGLLALQEATRLALPIQSFTLWTAWILVIVITGLSVIGVHQFISFSIAASLLIPLHPKPVLFIIASTIGWALGSIVGPLSGVTNYMNGQFGIRNLALVRANLVSAGIGVALALPILAGIDAFL